jgi:pyruvate dehydrogenase E2 component (dihydrolipoamide acetyltransferase)
MIEFRLPSLGADMTAATLVSWKIRPGDVVSRGQVVAEVETDKGVIDVECFNEGTVERLVSEPGQKLPVGALMAVIRGSVDDEPSMSAAPRPNVAANTISEPSATTSGGRLKITPAARKRAGELGIALEQLHGSESDGVIGLTDVEKAAAAAAPSTSPLRSEDGCDRMRRAIAAAMSKSKREIPHYYLATKIDMSRALAWLESENLKRPLADRILPAVLTLKAVALSLHDIPELNGFWIDSKFRSGDGVHVGLAVAMKGGGLVAPAIHDADEKTLDEIMSTLHDLIPRARSGRLRSSELTDATATLTNLGDLGVEVVFGVIYPPQVALIGLGKITQQPWVADDKICARPVLTATLSADHRATDGRRGGQFLDALNRRLQTPEKL